MKESTDKKEDSRKRQKRWKGFKIHASTCLKIEAMRETSKRKCIPQVVRVRKEIVGVQEGGEFSYFDSEMVGPLCQSNSTLIFR